MLDDAIVVEVFGPLHLQTQDELRAHYELVKQVRGFDGATIDTLVALATQGPLFDGDVPSKSGRDTLMELGAAAKVSVKGEEGYNACTQLGAWMYKIHQALKQ